MMNMSIVPQALVRRVSTPFRQNGFSLIELMIAITLGLLIMIAMTSAYVQIASANRELAKTNEQIESGRIAVQLIGNDLVHAGYWGGFVPAFDDLTQTAIPGDAPTAVPDPCLAYSVANWNTAYWSNLIGIPVQAYDAASVCSSVMTNMQANSDVLVVRHAATCVAGASGCEALTTNKLYFQPSYCTSDAQPYLTGQYGAVTLNNHKRDCTTVADMRKFISNIYYIRNYYTTAGDNIPTLMSSSFDLAGGTLAHQAAQPLIPGIAAIRVELGVDSLSRTGAAVNYTQAVAWSDPSTMKIPTNRGDGAPDGNDVHCSTATTCTVAQLSNVVVVRIYVLAQSLQTTPGYTDTKTYALGGATLGPFNDHYKRHVYATTVRLNNTSGRRDTP